MSSWQRVTYPSYSGAWLQVTNLLSQGAGNRLPLVVDDKAYHVQLSSAAAGSAAVGDSVGQIALQCSLNDHPVTIYLGENTCSALLDDLIPFSAFCALQADIQLALLEAAVASFTHVLEDRLGTTLRITGLEVLPTGATVSGLLFTIAPLQEQADWSVDWSVLVAPHPILASAFSHWLQGSDLPGQPRDYDWLPLPVEMVAGQVSLPVATVEGLGIGDIVLLDTCYLTDEQLRVSIADHFSCLAQVDGDNLIVRTQLVRTQLEVAVEDESAIHPDSQNDPSAVDNSAVDNSAVGEKSSADPTAIPANESPEPTGGNNINSAALPVNLRFVVGSTTMTLEELRNVQPGYVFDLKNSPEQAVEIRANGAFIGRGELVEVDGRLGVRILEYK